jgi:hypothetical protein
MGLDIGSSVRAIASVVPASFSRPDRSAVSRDSRSEEAGQLVRRPEAPPIRAGFGENTLSPSGAALKTLDSNLEAALQLVPTVEELRERARVNQASRADAVDATSERERTGELRRLETLRPEPNASARNFVTEPLPAPAPADQESPSEEVREADTTRGRNTDGTVPTRFDVRV